MPSRPLYVLSQHRKNKRGGGALAPACGSPNLASNNGPNGGRGRPPPHARRVCSPNHGRAPPPAKRDSLRLSAKSRYAGRPKKRYFFRIHFPISLFQSGSMATQTDAILFRNGSALFAGSQSPIRLGRRIFFARRQKVDHITQQPKQPKM